MRLLDTSVLAKWGHPTENDAVVPYLQAHADEQFVASSLVLSKFFRPAKRRSNSHEVHAWLGTVLDGIEPFTQSASLTAATIEAKLQAQETALSMRDLLIASHNRDLDATFVTMDKGDFQREPVQQLVNVDVIT